MFDRIKAFVLAALSFILSLCIGTGGGKYDDLLEKTAGMELIALSDQKHQRVVVFNVADEQWTDDTALWEWSAHNAYYRSVSDMKLRYSNIYGGYVMVTCASEGYAAIVAYPSGKVLWKTFTFSNLHSVELLPNGNIVVAASTESYFRIYTASQSSKKYFQYAFPDAHGVLWDDVNNCLWVLGESRLAAYVVTGTADAPDVIEIGCISANIPEELGLYGHDLAPVYGNKSLLWVTNTNGVYQYNKTNNTFSSAYANSNYICREDIKGIGNTPKTGTVVSIYPSGVYEDWCTDKVNVIDSGGIKTMVSKTDAYYKVRVWCSDYT